ncbi:MAG: helix-turn-helix domain-containing protein [Hominimerdicola sp.]
MFYDIFKEQCGKIGKKPTTVANELGINKSTLSYWKKNGTEPKVSVLVDIANYFNLPVSFFTKEKEPPESDPLSDEAIKLIKSLSEESLAKLIDYAQLLLNAEQNQ